MRGVTNVVSACRHELFKIDDRGARESTPTAPPRRVSSGSRNISGSSRRRSRTSRSKRDPTKRSRASYSTSPAEGGPCGRPGGHSCDSVRYSSVMRVHPSTRRVGSTELIEVASDCEFCFMPKGLYGIGVSQCVCDGGNRLVAPGLPCIPRPLRGERTDPGLVTALLMGGCLCRVPMRQRLTVLGGSGVRVPGAACRS